MKEWFRQRSQKAARFNVKTCLKQLVQMGDRERYSSDRVANQAERTVKQIGDMIQEYDDPAPGAAFAWHEDVQALLAEALTQAKTERGRTAVLWVAKTYGDHMKQQMDAATSAFAKVAQQAAEMDPEFAPIAKTLSDLTETK